MGNNFSAPLCYCKETTLEHGETESAIFRHPDSVSQDIFNMPFKYRTLQDAFRTRFYEHPDDNCFGVFDRTENQGHSDTVRWLSNREVLERSEAFGSGLFARGLVPEVKEWREMAFRFVGIYGRDCLETLLCDIGAIAYNLTTVPINESLGIDAIGHIFEQTQLPVCLVAAKFAEEILRRKKQSGQYSALKAIVVVDPEKLIPGLQEKYDNCLQVFSFREIEEAGRCNRRPWASVSHDTIFTFSYTSGTTGRPKGVMLSHGNLISVIASVDRYADLLANDVHFHYLPFAHVLERAVLYTVLTYFAGVVLSTGEKERFKQEIRAARPTLFVGVPRVYNRFFEGINKEIEGSNPLSKSLARRALQIKQANLARDACYSHSVYDTLVFARARAMLGGRVRLMLTGAAPIKPEVLAFLKVAFGCPILEGYGQTEGTGFEFATVTRDGMGGHVGGPFPHNEFKLVDLPDMHYSAKDTDPEGRPTPRGEIYVRGPNISKGYYKDDEKNAETFSPDGWLISGDIGMIFGEERRVKIVDRKKNLIKLAQGEYIAPERLEEKYREASEEIKGVLVYGDPNQSSLLAVLSIPDEGLTRLGEKLGVQVQNLDEARNNAEFKKKLIELLDQKANEAGFNGLERIKGVIIEPKTFIELDLENDAHKFKRQEASERYKQQFEEEYKRI